MEIDLNELERLANAATPGPWVRQDFYSSGSRFGVDGPDGEVICASFGAARSADYEHIAAANPAVVLELVRRLRQSGMDAERYRKLRDENAWGEDVALGSGSAWEMLGELHGSNFDMFVDARFQVTKGHES